MDKKKSGQERRDLLKGLFLAGTAAILGTNSKKAEAQSLSEGHSDEILYRETEEFRAYYDSLLDS